MGLKERGKLLHATKMDHLFSLLLVVETNVN